MSFRHPHLFARPRLLLVLPLIVLVAGGCREEGDIEVKSISFSGTEAIDAGRLEDVMATKTSSRLPWGANQFFNRERLETDLRRIENYYAQRGYPDAQVTNLDVQLNDAQDEVRIAITIDEGQPVVVERIEWIGFDVIPPDALERLRNQVPLKEGQPLDRAVLQTTREAALNQLRDHGYPYAKVDVAEVAPASHRAAIQIGALPGTLARYGEIDIVGNTSVGNNVIARQVTFEPGEVYRLSELRETQRRLYGLELFQFANVETASETGTAVVPMRITVAEADHQQVQFGVGYGTEEKARGQIQYRHVNFLGGARAFGTRAKWSSLDRGVRLDFTEPHFFTSALALGLNGQYWQAREPAYDLDTIGGRATVSHRIFDRGALAGERSTTTLSGSLIHEYEEFSVRPDALLDLSLRDELIALGLDPTTGFGEGTLAALAFDFARDTTDNILDARSGYIASLHVEQALRILRATYKYTEFSAEGRHYLAFLERFVLAHKVRFASINSATRADIPFFKRYFLGGSTSLRGWGRYEVGPISGSGLTLGGQTLVEVTSELRTPLVGNLGLVVFVDGGDVWSDDWHVELGELRYDVGTGLRYNTPIGPVRFDFAYQLTPIEGLLVAGEPQTRRWRVHFSIGQAF